MKSMFTFVIIFAVPHLAFALTSKAEFEQRSGVLVWDSGKSKGIVDVDDQLTDLTVPCSYDDDNERQVMKTLRNRALSSPIEVNDLATSLMTSVGIKSQVVMNPVLAFRGNPQEPLFLLFPETHIQGSPSASTVLLHRSRAVDMVRVTNDLVKNKITVLNFDEGPLGLPWTKGLSPAPVESEERLKWADDVLKTYSLSGSILVGEAYYPTVKTAYNDDNDLWIRWVLTVTAVGRQSWNQVFALVASGDRASEAQIRLEDYHGFYQNLLRLKADVLKSNYSRLCESRSQKMASFSYESAKAQGANVILMSFGSFHAYGIIEQLKKYSASFIVFSPNY